MDSLRPQSANSDHSEASSKSPTAPSSPTDILQRLPQELRTRIFILALVEPRPCKAFLTPGFPIAREKLVPQKEWHQDADPPLHQPAFPRGAWRTSETLPWVLKDVVERPDKLMVISINSTLRSQPGARNVALVNHSLYDELMNVPTRVWPPLCKTLASYMEFMSEYTCDGSASGSGEAGFPDGGVVVVDGEAVMWTDDVDRVYFAHPHWTPLVRLALMWRNGHRQGQTSGEGLGSFMQRVGVKKMEAIEPVNVARVVAEEKKKRKMKKMNPKA